MLKGHRARIPFTQRFTDHGTIPQVSQQAGRYRILSCAKPRKGNQTLGASTNANQRVYVKSTVMSFAE